MARRCGVADWLGGCARPVQPAVNFGPLEQYAVVYQLLEALRRDERVVDAVDLTGARGPGGHGYSKVQVGNPVTQAADHSGFPDGRGTGQHHNAAQTLSDPRPAVTSRW